MSVILADHADSSPVWMMEKEAMKKADVKKFESRYAELCDEIGKALSSEQRDTALQVEENTRCRAAYFTLESIRALQVVGFDAEYIVNELVRAAESRVMPPKKLEQTPKC